MREQNPVLSLPNEFTHTSIWKVGSKRTPQATKCNFCGIPPTFQPVSTQPCTGPCSVPSPLSSKFWNKELDVSCHRICRTFLLMCHQWSHESRPYQWIPQSQYHFKISKKVFSLLLMKSLHNGVCYGLKQKCFWKLKIWMCVPVFQSCSEGL